MPKKITNRYFVRNKLHQAIGDFSEEEIISQIKKGKFTGDEEAAPIPGNEWRKLSSLPVFYDALLNRALGLNAPESLSSDQSVSQQEPNPEGPLPAGHKNGEATEVVAAHLPEMPGEQQDATAQLHHSVLLSPRISDSEIADLFSGVSKTSDPGLLQQPIEDLGGGAGAESSKAALATPKSKRRVLLWGGVLILLGMLFLSGNQKESSLKAEKKEGVVPAPDESSRADNDDSRIFISKSAAQALQHDSPPAFLLAAELFEKAILSSPSDLELYDGAAMSLAKSLEEEPQNAKTLEKFANLLVRGRALEAQRTAFFRAEALVAKAQGEKKRAEQLLEQAIETDSLNPENMLVQAEWLVEENKFNEAAPILKSILDLNPQSLRANYLLAMSEFKLGNLAEAWNQAQKVTQINPTHPATYVLMGDVLAKKNDLKAAQAIYLLASKFAALAPKRIAEYAFLRAGNLSDISGDPKEARRLYLLAGALEKVDPPPAEGELAKAQSETLADPAYFERLGSESIELKSFERAEGFYLAATLVFPSVGKLWVRLGETREALARSREEFRWAAMTYEKATQVNPDEAEAYLRLGLLESEQSNWNRALQALRHAEEAAPEDPMVQLALGKHFFARKDFRSATDRLRAARRINPGLAEVSYYQGMLYKIFDPENPQAAMRNFEEAYSKDPGNYDALAEWLKLKVITFEKMFAIKFLRNMSANDPENPKLLWVFGEVYSANKEFNRAIQYYRKALDLDKSSAKVRLSMAKALASLGRIDEAIAEYKLASDLDSKNGDGYFYAAELLYQTKNYPMVRDLLTGLLKVIPNYPGARRLLAMSYQAMNQPDLAIPEMTREARSNPMNYQFAIELAELLMVNQKFVEATQELAAITNLPVEKTVPDQRAPTGFKKEPTGLKSYRVKGLLLLSRCYRQLKRYEPAEGAILSALALDPENLDLKLERGFVAHNLGRYTDAAKDFNEFLSKNPNSVEAPAVKQLLNSTVIEE